MSKARGQSASRIAKRKKGLLNENQPFINEVKREFREDEKIQWMERNKR